MRSDPLVIVGVVILAAVVSLALWTLARAAAGLLWGAL